jgi:hypothetical protein
MRPGRNVSFVVFVIGAIMAGANAGRIAALLRVSLARNRRRLTFVTPSR